MVFKVDYNNILNQHLENDITYIYLLVEYRIHKIYDIKIIFVYIYIYKVRVYVIMYVIWIILMYNKYILIIHVYIFYFL